MGEFMNTDRQHELLIAERATQWLSQLRTAGVTERRAFVKWMKQSPLHVREALLATAWDTVLRVLDMERKVNSDQLMEKSARNVTALSPASRSDNRPAQHADSHPADPDIIPEIHEVIEPAATAAGMKTRKWKPARWIVGFAAAASILAGLALGWPGIIKGIGLPQQYQTDTGEQRTILLTDGSVIYLNTQSLARVAFSRDARDIYLDEGQAIFNVAHDTARPFRVHVDHAIVQAIGTQFDVNRQTARTDVAVIEGRVKIIAEDSDSDAQSLPDTEVSAGKGITIAAGRTISAPVDVNMADVVAWRQRQLVFRNQTLVEMAAAFNRYNQAPKIRVEGAAAAQTRTYSGNFNADDLESFVQYLEQENELLAFERSDEFIVIRMRSHYATTSPKK
jgi:transmembrane sensor